MIVAMRMNVGFLVNERGSILPYLRMKVLNARCEPEYIAFVDAWKCYLRDGRTLVLVKLAPVVSC